MISPTPVSVGSRLWKAPQNVRTTEEAGATWNLLIPGGDMAPVVTGRGCVQLGNRVLELFGAESLTSSSIGRWRLGGIVGSKYSSAISRVPCNLSTGSICSEWTVGARDERCDDRDDRFHLDVL